MQMFYITNDCKIIELTGTLEERFVKAEHLSVKNSGGFIGVVDKHLIKSFWSWRHYDKTFRTKLREYIKKYMMLDALRNHLAEQPSPEKALDKGSNLS